MLGRIDACAIFEFARKYAHKQAQYMSIFEMESSLAIRERKVSTGVVNFISWRAKGSSKINAWGPNEHQFMSFSIHFYVFQRWLTSQTTLVGGPDLANGSPTENSWVGIIMSLAIELKLWMFELLATHNCNVFMYLLRIITCIYNWLFLYKIQKK